MKCSSSGVLNVTRCKQNRENIFAITEKNHGQVLLAAPHHLSKLSMFALVHDICNQHPKVLDQYQHIIKP